MSEVFYSKGSYYFKHLDTYNGCDIYICGPVLVPANIEKADRMKIYENLQKRIG